MILEPLLIFDNLLLLYQNEKWRILKNIMKLKIIRTMKKYLIDIFMK